MLTGTSTRQTSVMRHEVSAMKATIVPHCITPRAATLALRPMMSLIVLQSADSRLVTSPVLERSKKPVSCTATAQECYLVLCRQVL